MKRELRRQARNSPSPTGIYEEIRDRLRRAARNGERLHLDPRHVRALIASPIFLILAELEQAELKAQWEAESAGDGEGPP